MEAAVRQLINHFDKDPTREGLKDTPRRYVKFLTQFLNPEPFNFTTFKNEGADQLVLVKDIPFYSMCEHHLAPFMGKAHIAYIPNERIVGISKIPRLLDHHANQFQNQERITQGVCDELNDKLKPKGVAVMLSAMHTCMSMRGVKKHGAETVTTAFHGIFKDDVAARNEYMMSIRSA